LLLRWSWKPFDALTPQELYAALALRNEVFVVEQNCVFQDADGSDFKAHHLLGFRDGVLVAYARCFDKDIKFKEASIGRVITSSSQRGTGLGHELMRQSIAQLHVQWGVQPIRIGAQARLEKFYQQHGFAAASAPYMEDGIPHIEMLRQTEQRP
jgi:ElaA protein